jgi:hypothetical protein
MSNYEEEIPLIQMSESTIRRVIQYLEHIAAGNNEPEIERPLRSNDIRDVVTEWMADFI